MADFQRLAGISGQKLDARSVVSFEAPVESKYKWLNDYIFLGTLERAPGYEKEPAVIIRVWKVL